MTESIGRVLFVDSDLFLIDKFRREVSQNEEIKVITAINGEIALKTLELFKTDLVIANLDLSDMDGLRFLLMVKLKYPKIDRVILTKEEDINKSESACQRGCALSILTKPWNNGYMRENIYRLLDERSKNKKDSFQTILDEINIMPTLSSIYSDILFAVSEEASFSRLADIISRDVSLSTLVLKIANSAFHGFEKTNSLERAIMIVGAQQLKDIALNYSLTKNMHWSDKQRSIVSEISVHSLIVNRYLYVFYKLKFDQNLPKEYSSIGITHDIGKLIMLQFFPEKFEQINDLYVDNKQLDFYQTELKLGYDGYTHCEIGSYFLKHWGLPEANEIGALFHHNPLDGPIEMKDTLQMLNFVDAFVNYVWRLRNDPFWDPEKFLFDHTFNLEMLKEKGDMIIRDMGDLTGSI